MDSRPIADATTRRAVLGGTAVAAGSLAGCVKRMRNIVARDRSPQVTLEIKTLPADSDPYAIHIARQLAANLDEVGVDATVTPVGQEALLRQVLVNHDFDLFVAQFPEPRHIDPDSLYPFLHSDFAGEPGWQNPFGYADLETDDLLENQRTVSGTDRREIVDELQRTIARNQPFQVVCFPDVLHAVRDTRLSHATVNLSAPLEYLRVDVVEDGDAPEDALRVVVTDSRITENRNPIAVEFRRYGTITDLIYDPLARRYDGEIRPWLSKRWEWEPDGRPTLGLTLREDLAWHDGTDLTAEDVEFTYRFLADTSLGESDAPVPATRFREQSSLIESVRTADERTVEIEFVDCDRAVALLALTVPVLPAHVWTDRSDSASLAGIEVAETTEALVWNNPEPIGSGPFAFEESEAKERVELSQFDDHFLAGNPPDVPEQYHGGPSFDRLIVKMASSANSAVELVAANDADATVSNLGPEVVRRIGRETDLRLSVWRSRSFYMVGHNARQSPFANPRFRRVTSRLLDKEHLVREVFDGYALPAASPLAGSDWVPVDLRWEGEDPELPFLGTDGELDAERAREAFREAGYAYTNDGELQEG